MDKNLYVFKDPDGYFIGLKNSTVVKKITKNEYLDYRRVLPEYELKKENKSEKRISL